MSAAVGHDPEPLVELRPRLVVRAVLSMRREFARETRYRVAFTLTALLVAFDWLGHGFAHADVTSTLAQVSFCAALAVSGTLVPLGRDSDLQRLAQLRGLPNGLHGRALPLARAALAFWLHGGAALLLGLGRCFSGDTAAEVVVGLGSVLALVAVSALGSLALSLLAWLCVAVLPRGAAWLYFASLLLPAALQTSLFEVPSLLDLWERAVAYAAGGLPS